MVAHEHPRVDGNVELDTIAAQPFEIGATIAVREKAFRAIVAALYNVQRETGEIGAGAARHGRINAGDRPSVDVQTKSRI
jgi:hypothetical protein